MKRNYAKNIQKLCLKISKNNSILNRLRSQSETVIVFLLGILILTMVLYPFLLLIFKSFGITIQGGSFTTEKYLMIFQDKQTYNAFKNTIYTSVGVTIIATFIGGSLAWIVTRTDFPYKKIVEIIIFLAFTIPSHILAISWIELMGRNGYINNIVINFFRITDYKSKAYSLIAVILVMSIHLYPLAFMSIANALRKTDNSLEEAAIMSGASRFKAVRTITIPLIMPSIFSIGLLIFSRTMANFEVSATLALPIGKETLSTRIYSALANLDLSLAVAISVILVAFSIIVFGVNNICLMKKEFTVVTGSSSLAKTVKLGKWKCIVVIIVFLFQAVTTIAPLATILVSSFLKKWGLNPVMSNFTLNNYKKIFFRQSMAGQAFKNSIFYGVIAASIAVFIGTVVSYIANSSKDKKSKVIELIASIPMVIPNIVMALAAILAWSNPPVKLYGTPWIIIVTYVVLFLPLVIKNVSGLIYNQDISLENAARMSGASKIKAIRDITFPMIKSGMQSGWIVCFLIALRELPISLMLYSQENQTIGVLLFNLRSDSGGLEMTSAIAVIVILFSTAGRLIINKTKNSKIEVKINEKS